VVIAYFVALLVLILFSRPVFSRRSSYMWCEVFGAGNGLVIELTSRAKSASSTFTTAFQPRLRSSCLARQCLLDVQHVVQGELNLGGTGDAACLLGAANADNRAGYGWIS
jgi:hypothetical protein